MRPQGRQQPRLPLHVVGTAGFAPGRGRPQHHTVVGTVNLEGQVRRPAGELLDRRDVTETGHSLRKPLAEGRYIEGVLRTHLQVHHQRWAFSSKRATSRRCTSSGPSAIRRVRSPAHISANGEAWLTPAPP